MTEHCAEVAWTNHRHPELADSYSRDHTVTLENGHSLLNSAAAAYAGNTAASNPETLLLAALASCHMLTFLAITAKRGFPVASYRDKAIGVLGENAAGRMAVTRCILNPIIEFMDGNTPSAEQLRRFHHSAHRNCFIANSLNAAVDIVI